MSRDASEQMAECIRVEVAAMLRDMADSAEEREGTGTLIGGQIALDPFALGPPRAIAGALRLAAAQVLR